MPRRSHSFKETQSLVFSQVWLKIKEKLTSTTESPGKLILYIDGQPTLITWIRISEGGVWAFVKSSSGDQCTVRAENLLRQINPSPPPTPHPLGEGRLSCTWGAPLHPKYQHSDFQLRFLEGLALLDSLHTWSNVKQSLSLLSKECSQLLIPLFTHSTNECKFRAAFFLAPRTVPGT